MMNYTPSDFSCILIGVFAGVICTKPIQTFRQARWMVLPIMLVYGLSLVILHLGRTGREGVLIDYSAHFQFILYGLLLGTLSGTIWRVYRMSLERTDLSEIGKIIAFFMFPISVPLFWALRGDDDAESDDKPSPPFIALSGFAFLIFTLALSVSPRHFHYTIEHAGKVVVSGKFPCTGTFLSNMNHSDYAEIDADRCRTLFIGMNGSDAPSYHNGRHYKVGEPATFTDHGYTISVTWP